MGLIVKEHPRLNFIPFDTRELRWGYLSYRTVYQQSFVCLCLRYNEGHYGGSGGLWTTLCPAVCGVSSRTPFTLMWRSSKPISLPTRAPFGVRALSGIISPREGLSYLMYRDPCIHSSCDLAVNTDFLEMSFSE